mgnify:CR=1 FL=1
MSESNLKSLFEHKKKAKKELLNKLSIKEKTPILGIILEKEINEEEEETLSHLLQGFKNTEIEVVILGDEKFKKNSHLLNYTKQNRKLLLEGSDMALSFSFNDVQEMLVNGTVPISLKRPEIKNYNPNKESGNGFVFNLMNPWSIFAASIRALETYKFPYDWKNIVRRCLETELV